MTFTHDSLATKAMGGTELMKYGWAERVQGEIFRRDVPESITKADIAIMAESMVAGLAQLHSVDASVLQELNKGAGYVERQVSGWSKRYRAALTDDVPDGEAVMNWLVANQPNDVDSCVN